MSLNLTKALGEIRVGMVIRVIRVISLVVLCGGSAGVVMAALASVKSAEQHGISVPEAALANVPAFIVYGKAAIVFALLLLVMELLDYLSDKKVDFARLLRYGSSLSCFLAAVFFSAAIVPRMQMLLPSIQSSLSNYSSIGRLSQQSPSLQADEKKIRSNPAAHAAFQQLHESSRLAVTAIILFAFASLAIPLLDALYKLRYEEEQEELKQQSETKTLTDGAGGDQPT
jgi:hypothetical protein